jgi:hypothetical protein
LLNLRRKHLKLLKIRFMIYSKKKRLKMHLDRKTGEYFQVY